jgi:hypothetical protein
MATFVRLVNKLLIDLVGIDEFIKLAMLSVQSVGKKESKTKELRASF